VQERVWILRPTPTTGPKIQTWWQGPFLITQLNESQSYTVDLSTGNSKRFHVDQMKKCVQTDTPELVNLLIFEGASTGNFTKIQKIWGQRILDEAGNFFPLQFLVQWEGLTKHRWSQLEEIADLDPKIVNLFQYF